MENLTMTTAAPEPKANMGPAIPRYDAVAKVTGKAAYAADVPLVRPVHAYLVTQFRLPTVVSRASSLSPPNRFAASSTS